jgi:DNA-binding transcriptional regulator YiaG
MKEITFETALRKISTLKQDPLIPKNWARIIAKRIGVSDVTIREWAAGKKKRPQGAITVLKMMQDIKVETQNQIHNSEITT